MEYYPFDNLNEAIRYRNTKQPNRQIFKNLIEPERQFSSKSINSNYNSYWLWYGSFIAVERAKKEQNAYRWEAFKLFHLIPERLHKNDIAKELHKAPSTIGRWIHQTEAIVLEKMVDLGLLDPRLEDEYKKS